MCSRAAVATCLLRHSALSACGASLAEGLFVCAAACVAPPIYARDRHAFRRMRIPADAERSACQQHRSQKDKLANTAVQECGRCCQEQVHWHSGAMDPASQHSRWLVGIRTRSLPVFPTEDGVVHGKHIITSMDHMIASSNGQRKGS